jgi:hypothetical protein
MVGPQGSISPASWRRLCVLMVGVWFLGGTTGFSFCFSLIVMRLLRDAPSLSPGLVLLFSTGYVLDLGSIGPWPTPTVASLTHWLECASFGSRQAGPAFHFVRENKHATGKKSEILAPVGCSNKIFFFISLLSFLDHLLLFLHALLRLLCPIRRLTFHRYPDWKEREEGQPHGSQQAAAQAVLFQERQGFQEERCRLSPVTCPYFFSPQLLLQLELLFNICSPPSERKFAICFAPNSVHIF